MSGNSFGKLFSVTTFGESHGKAIGCIVDGCPPGYKVSEKDIHPDLNRRTPGQSKYTTPHGFAGAKTKLEITNTVIWNYIAWKEDNFRGRKKTKRSRKW